MTSIKKNLPLGVLCCMLGWFFFTASITCNKLVIHNVSILTILLFQNAICLFLTIPLIAWNRSSLKTKRWGLHLFRDIVGMLIIFFIFSALKTIPLVDGTLLQNTAPLWIPLIVFVWLGIRIRRHLWWGNIMGFVGIVLILKPGVEALSIGALYALASGLGTAFSIVVTALLSRTEPTERTLFYFFLFGTLVTLAMAFFGFSIPSKQDLIYLIGVGIFTYLSVLLTTYSMQHGKASVLGPIAYSSVVFAGIFDYLIWDHIPDLLTFLGSAIVITGSLLSIHFESRYQKIIGESMPKER
jgi:drug/metabolite transporter (DMT)-like permease